MRFSGGTRRKSRPGAKRPQKTAKPVASGAKARSIETMTAGLESLCENCKISTSAAKAAPILQLYVAAKAATHKHFRVFTQAIKSALPNAKGTLDVRQ